MQTNQTDITKQHQHRCQYLFLVFSIDVKFSLSMTIAIVDTVTEKNRYRPNFRREARDKFNSYYCYCYYYLFLIIILLG
ncbi:hypothetical protein Hanom_Chr04g00376541 [Helianthus anomalus]